MKNIVKDVLELTLDQFEDDLKKNRYLVCFRMG